MGYFVIIFCGGGWKQRPVIDTETGDFSVADNEQNLQAAQGDQRSNVLQAPKVTLFNGQQASVIGKE